MLLSLLTRCWCPRMELLYSPPPSESTSSWAWVAGRDLIVCLHRAEDHSAVMSLFEEPTNQHLAELLSGPWLSRELAEAPKEQSHMAVCEVCPDQAGLCSPRTPRGRIHTGHAAVCSPVCVCVCVCQSDGVVVGFISVTCDVDSKLLQELDLSDFGGLCRGTEGAAAPSHSEAPRVTSLSPNTFSLRFNAALTQLSAFSPSRRVLRRADQKVLQMKPHFSRFSSLLSTRTTRRGDWRGNELSAMSGCVSLEDIKSSLQFVARRPPSTCSCTLARLRRRCWQRSSQQGERLLAGSC